MTRNFPWTHFFVNEDGMCTGFSVSYCESCGEQIQAANSITIMETPGFLKECGLIQVTRIPPEGYYSEKLDGEACYGCNR